VAPCALEVAVVVGGGGGGGGGGVGGGGGRWGRGRSRDGREEIVMTGMLMVLANLTRYSQARISSAAAVMATAAETLMVVPLARTAMEVGGLGL